MTSATLTHAADMTERRASRAVVLWLYAVAALVMLMVVVGGATRLTDSGLSITEWQVVTGTVPPLTEEAWQEEFEKYRQIPQYQLVNRGMSLDEFKTIYWWEWGHRFLGRLIGFAFVVPFVWFAATGRIERRDYPPLVGLFVLGGLQGALGWFMVVSGLTERVSVSQYRLAAHLTLACIILVAILWVVRSMQLRGAVREAAPLRLVVSAKVLLGLVLVQIFLGGIVAGLNAGLAFNTWPLMEGRLIPPAAGLFAMEPAWRNFFENVTMVQFTHRMAAYVLFAFALWHATDAVRHGHGTAAAGRSVVLAGLMTAQAMIGIWTLVAHVPLGLALLHQAGAVVVLTFATIHARDLCGSLPAKDAEKASERLARNPSR